MKLPDDLEHKSRRLLSGAGFFMLFCSVYAGAERDASRNARIIRM